MWNLPGGTDWLDIVGLHNSEFVFFFFLKTVTLACIALEKILKSSMPAFHLCCVEPSVTIISLIVWSCSSSDTSELSILMCMCMHVHTHAHTHTHTHTHAHAHTHARAPTPTHPHARTHVHTHTHPLSCKGGLDGKPNTFPVPSARTEALVN